MSETILSMKSLPTVLCHIALGSLVAAADKPNILFVLADDLGCMDINACAARVTGTSADKQYYETPNLDRLAQSGTAFSQAYASQLCSPTRAGLLTGRNPARIGVTTATPGSVKTFYNQGRAPLPGYLAHDAIYWGDPISIQQALVNGSTLDALPAGQPLDRGRDEITLAEALTGYRSAFIGKWHLGNHGAKGWQPADQGFEELAYLDDGASPYFDWRKPWNNRKKHFPAMPQPELLQGKTDPAARAEYLTDALTESAVGFLRAQAESPNARPFFLYFCHFAVHTPFQGRPDWVKHFESKATRGWNGHSNAVYAAMLKSLDDSVGRLLDELDRSGLASNTIVVFMSDNGGVTYTDPAATSNAPFKGGKAMHFEGGIRVPLFFRWPGRIPAGQWCDVPVTYEDLFPTLLDLSGLKPEPHYPRIDGRSLKPLFADTANARRTYPRDTFYWHYPFNVKVSHPDDRLPPAPHSTIRKGDFKLIYDWSGRLFLYDLKADWQEQHNLADEKPDLAKSLFAELNRWLDAEVAERYQPALNPDYDPAKETRSHPFVDLRAKLLGVEHSIRSAASDPRLSELTKPPPTNEAQSKATTP